MTRRQFLRSAAWAGGAALLAAQTGCRSLAGAGSARGGSMMGFRAPPLPRIRVGIMR
ncbi:MAG: hypothetical protein GX748_02725, partial [Lentisphaerae bacterium]|nr:hypothetical protein [Lentisphaerota bacterium]